MLHTTIVQLRALHCINENLLDVSKPGNDAIVLPVFNEFGDRRIALSPAHLHDIFDPRSAPLPVPLASEII